MHVVEFKISTNSCCFAFWTGDRAYFRNQLRSWILMSATRRLESISMPLQGTTVSTGLMQVLFHATFTMFIIVRLL